MRGRNDPGSATSQFNRVSRSRIQDSQLTPSVGSTSSPAEIHTLCPVLDLTVSPLRPVSVSLYLPDVFDVVNLWSFETPAPVLYNSRWRAKLRLPLARLRGLRRDRRALRRASSRASLVSSLRQPEPRQTHLLAQPRRRNSFRPPRPRPRPRETLLFPVSPKPQSPTPWPMSSGPSQSLLFPAAMPSSLRVRRRIGVRPLSR